MSEEIMQEHITLNLDLALAREAAEVLGTEGITDTVHAALRAVVKQHKLERLLEYEISGLTPEPLERARRARGG